jgi:hypothetical protein
VKSLLDNKESEVQMRIIRWLIMGGIAGCFCPIVVTGGGVGTTGVAFLKLAMDARSAAIGGMQAVPLEHSSAIFGNPAGLAEAQTMGFSFTYASWFQGIRFGNLSFVYPRESYALSAGAIYLDYGDIPGYDVEAVSTGDFSANDFCGLLGASIKLSNDASIGGSLKFLNEKIDTETANGLGADFGAMYRYPSMHMQFGLVLQHLGIVDLKFVEEETPLPTSLRFGAAYSLLNTEWNLLTFVAEANSSFGNKVYFDGGAEYCYHELLSLRAGYRTGPSDEGSGLCAGAGFFWNQYGLNYAFEPFGELGNTHRFTFMVAL